MTGPPVALELVGIRKRFARVDALDGADLVVRQGTVHALLGENGAGKTTLMRIAYGLLTPDEGVMRVDGAAFSPDSPADAMVAGVGMVHQHFALVEAMRVTENVALGNHGPYRERDAVALAAGAARRSGLVIEPGARISDLAVPARQRVEIIKALARDAHILILDEPTAVLPPSEAAELLRWVREFAQDGRAAILITHKLRDALEISDDVTVLRAGRTVLTAATSLITADAIANAMLGETHRQRSREARQPASDVGVAVTNPVVEARALHIADAGHVERIRDASFRICPGEIVAVAGVDGAGQRELLRVLAGRLQPSRGHLMLPASIGYVPEDRHRDGLVLEMSVAENVELRGAGGRRGWRRRRDGDTQTARLLAQHDIRAPGPATLAGALSGGNQQKLIVARELDPRPDLLVAEHPVRGLDVRAAAAVGERLVAAARAGTAVVLTSNDIDEMVELADRALVVHGGMVFETDVDARAIGRAMVGA